MAKTVNILVINDPNLNPLRLREPTTYENKTSSDLVEQLKQLAKENYGGILINAGTYAHIGIAIHNALLVIVIPYTEVHISNVYKGEAFLHHSYLSDQVIGVMSGLRFYGYEVTLTFFYQYFLED